MCLISLPYLGSRAIVPSVLRSFRPHLLHRVAVQGLGAEFREEGAIGVPGPRNSQHGFVGSHIEAPLVHRRCGGDRGFEIGLMHDFERVAAFSRP